MEQNSAQKAAWTRFLNFKKDLYAQYLSSDTLHKLVRIEQLFNQLMEHMLQLPEAPFAACGLDAHAERFIPWPVESVGELDEYFEDFRASVYGLHATFQYAVDNLHEVACLIEEGRLPLSVVGGARRGAADVPKAAVDSVAA